MDSATTAIGGGMVKIHNTYNDEIIKVPRDIVDMFEVWSVQIQRWSKISPDGCPTITYWGVPKLLTALIILASHRTLYKVSLETVISIEAHKLGLHGEMRLLVKQRATHGLYYMKLIGDTYKATLDCHKGEYTIYSEYVFSLASHESCLTKNKKDNTLVISPAKKIASTMVNLPHLVDFCDRFESIVVTVKFDAAMKPIVTTEYTISRDSDD